MWRNTDNEIHKHGCLTVENPLCQRLWTWYKYKRFSCAWHDVILGSGVTASLIRDLSNKCYVSCQLNTPAEISREQHDPYPLNRMLGGHQKQCGRFAQDESVFNLPGIKPRCFGYPARSQVTISKSLYRLSYPSYGSKHRHTVILHCFHKLLFIF
jgi:hypothetical protein